MKTNSTIKLILGVGILFSIFYFLFSVPVMAQVRLETGLPNIPGGQIPAGREFPDYINYLFLFGLGLITVVALAQMMIGGLKYILAAGNVGTMEDAKKQIQQALIGMAVILLSYLLLRTINPDLVNLRNPGLVPLDLKSTEIPGSTITPGAPGVNLINCPGPSGGWQCDSTQICSPNPDIRCVQANQPISG